MDKIIDFLKSDNFMKLVYIAVVLAIVAFGYVNKQEMIDLYKYTLSVCT